MSGITLRFHFDHKSSLKIRSSRFQSSNSDQCRRGESEGRLVLRNVSSAARLATREGKGAVKAAARRRREETGGGWRNPRMKKRLMIRL